MKLVIMQPYFFPYLGQFDLANKADLWLAFDTPQHIPQGWVHRNRVLHPIAGWQHIIVPLKKHPYSTPINKLSIAEHIEWKARIFGQLSHYRREAPYYHQTIDFLRECLDFTGSSLSRLNVRSFSLTCQRLGIETPIKVFSELNLPSEHGKTPQDTAISRCLAVGASEYLNPPGGAPLYQADKFAEHGITLTIQSFKDISYNCGKYAFLPSLSIIDVMMWNKPEKIKQYLDSLKNNSTSEK